MSGLYALAIDDADRAWFLLTESEAQPGHPPFWFIRLLLAAPDGAPNWTMESLAEGYDWQVAADLVVTGSDTAHVAFRNVGGTLEYRWWAASDGWQDHPPGAFADGDIHIALGKDGQPRISFGRNGLVFLARRQIILLDHSAYVPAAAGSPP
jgi:hypothetical protein